MDAVKFFEAKRRICNSRDCNNCFLNVKTEDGSYNCGDLMLNDIEGLVRYVEAWAEANPVEED